MCDYMLTSHDCRVEHTESYNGKSRFEMVGGIVDIWMVESVCVCICVCMCVCGIVGIWRVESVCVCMHVCIRVCVIVNIWRVESVCVCMPVCMYECVIQHAVGLWKTHFLPDLSQLLSLIKTVTSSAQFKYRI